MENDFYLAEGRLRNLLVRLRRTPILLKAYDHEMKLLAEKGFVEEVNVGYEGIHKYVPHHPVIREDKVTTKIRPVFDGSAKGRFGPSINECLEVGPNLNPDLMAILMRFRIKRIAWIADIEKAFLNIALPEEDANDVRFLWSSNLSDPSARNIAFRWKRVPFGLTSSPFQLRATISKHLKLYQSKFPLLTRNIEEQLYVDDLLGGAHTLEEAEESILNTKVIFADAQLKMTKWTTSNPDLQKILEKEGLCYSLEGLLAQNLSTENPKVLGVSWDTKTDSFLFNPAEIIKAAKEIGDEPTKRNILQISSRIFDPMGFLAPTVLSLKMIFQRLWQDDAGWDKPVPKGVKKIWQKTIAGLHRLEELRIPRWVGTGPTDKPTELHVFGDASEAGYGAVAYIREERDGKFKTALLCSKTVVAPLPKKEVSLPRLELLSSLLAVRLGESVKNALCDRTFTTTYWSDSKVALGWIKGDSSRWQTYVKNRVDKIQQVSSANWWRHCPGVDNPADLASRGASADALIDSKLWWNGPSWLSEEESSWPTEDNQSLSEDDEVKMAAEKKRKVTMAATLVVERPIKLEWEDLEDVSS